VAPASYDASADQALAAAWGVEPWEALDALTSLVAKSMRNAGSSTTEFTRYHLLESLRSNWARSSTAKSALGTKVVLGFDALKERKRHLMSEGLDEGIRVPRQTLSLSPERLRTDLDLRGLPSKVCSRSSQT
jgi:hypothetical protein